jgi:hypothetical protein
VLADAGRDHGFAARETVDLLNHVVRLDQLAAPVVIHRVTALQLGDVRMPRRPVTPEARTLALQAQLCERRPQQSHMTPLHALDLVDLRSVNVHVRDALRVARELGRHARDAIVEAGAEAEQEIAVVDGIVGERRAVHAEHVQRERLGRIVRADAHQRGDDGYAEFVREGP